MEPLDPVELAWQALKDSSPWQNTLLPYLGQMKAQALEAVANAVDMDSVRYWQGAAKTIDGLISAPDDMLNLQEIRDKNERLMKERQRGRGRADTHWGRLRDKLGV